MSGVKTTSKKSKKTKKRANGEGTFYQLEDKTWVHQITLGRKPDGSPDRKTFSGKTRSVCIERRDAYREEKERLALRALEEQALREARLLEEQKKGHSLESEITFDESFLPWLNLFKSPPTKKATTYSGYLGIYQVHFKAFFGEKPLYEITQDVVQGYYLAKQKDGSRGDRKAGALSAKTIRNHHMLLKDFFAYAVKKYKLPFDPTHETERPEVPTPKTRVLEVDEMDIFLREVSRETQRVAIMFCLFTGVRVGELLATEVADINAKTQSIEINRNLARVKTDSIALDNPQIRILGYNPEKKTHLIIQETPKTLTSNRIIPLPDALFEMLARHLYFLEQSGWPNPNNLLFPSTKGTYIDPKSFEIRLNAISKRCEIKKVNPHALRHTFATRLVEEQVPLTTVQELLGHATLQSTQRYIRPLMQEKQKAMDSMSGYLSREKLGGTQKLNGTKNRMKYEDVRLPCWLQIEPKAAQI